MERDKYFVQTRLPDAKHKEYREHAINQAEYKLSEELIKRLKEHLNNPVVATMHSETNWECNNYEGPGEYYRASLRFDIPRIEKLDIPILPPETWAGRMWRKIRRACKAEL
jgi:hypothetical protein